MLAAMFSGRHPCSKDKDGRFFIDADGEIFCHILNYLRSNKLNRLPPGDVALLVYEQACYFGLQSLISLLESYSSVQLEKYLEKIRTAYPWYRDITDSISKQLNEMMQVGRIREHASIDIINQMSSGEVCNPCRNSAWRAVANDNNSDALDFLIRHELEKRNFDMTKISSISEQCRDITTWRGHYGIHTIQCNSLKRTIQVKF